MADALEHHEPPDIAQLRRDYRRDGLRRVDLAADPVAQFRRWFSQATAAELLEPNAMVLGTTDGVRPSSRTVLLKAFDSRGFVFFTNYESRKAKEMALVPHVSLLFPWYALERQVAILGCAERITAAESLAYFGTPEKRWTATRRMLGKKAGNTLPKPPSMRGLPSHSRLVAVDTTTSPMVNKAGAGCIDRDTANLLFNAQHMNKGTGRIGYKHVRAEGGKNDIIDLFF